MLPKIHKRLFNVPGRPVISNSGYFTENILAFVDYHLKLQSKQVKSFIKDTSDFLQKLNGLKDLPEDFYFVQLMLSVSTLKYHLRRDWKLLGKLSRLGKINQFPQKVF